MTDYKNRIISHGSKPASQFMAHPNNWRKHPKNQRSAVRGSLESLGWVAEVIENKTTGRLIDGHERVWNALQNGDAEVPFIQVELTEAEEAQALLSLDAIAAMAETDREQVNALLEQVETDNADVMNFLNQFSASNGIIEGVDYEKEWQGMPEFEMMTDKYRSLIVHFTNADDLKDFCSLVNQDVTDKTKFIWYPAKEKNDLKNLEFTNES